MYRSTSSYATTHRALSRVADGNVAGYQDIRRYISDTTSFLVPLIVASRTRPLSNAVPRISEVCRSRANGWARERGCRISNEIYCFAKRKPRERDAPENEARRTCCTGTKKNREPLGQSRCALPEAIVLSSLPPVRPTSGAFVRQRI